MRHWRLGSVALALSLPACAVGISEEPTDEVDTGVQTAELKNASLYNGSANWRGVVQLQIWRPGGWGICSGQVVSQHTILTAAHCLNSLGANPASTYVVAWKQTASGFVAVLPYTYAYIRYNPAYDGSAKNDVGLVISPTVQPLQNVTSSDAEYLAKTTPSGVNMVALGFGFYGSNDGDSDGMGRWAQLAPTYSSTDLDYVFMNPNTKPELCRGDSGGPLKSGTSGIRMQYGVASMGTGPGSGKCRAHSHWATTANNMTWLRGKITGTCAETSSFYSCW